MRAVTLTNICRIKSKLTIVSVIYMAVDESFALTYMVTSIGRWMLLTYKGRDSWSALWSFLIRLWAGVEGALSRTLRILYSLMQFLVRASACVYWLCKIISDSDIKSLRIWVWGTDNSIVVIITVIRLLLYIVKIIRETMCETKWFGNDFNELTSLNWEI